MVVKQEMEKAYKKSFFISEKRKDEWWDVEMIGEDEIMTK